MTTNSKKPPFFIVGCTRSGTTLLQTLLDAHPQIAIPPESHIFERFCDIFHHYGDLEEEANLRRLVKDLLTDVCIKRWGLRISASEFCNRLGTPSIGNVISLLFELYAERQGKVRWGDKTPQHVLYLKEIRNLFPDSKVIHMVRDGRDVAESLSRVFLGPKSIYRIALRWEKSTAAFRESKRFLNRNQILEIRYEDLIRNPQEEIRKVFAFLDEEPIPIELNVPDTPLKKFYIRAASHHGFLREPISDRKIGVFRKAFSTRKIEIFESIAGDLLELNGYGRITRGKREIHFHERIWFILQDYFFRYLRKLGEPAILAWDLKQTFQRSVRKFLRSRRNRFHTSAKTKRKKLFFTLKITISIALLGYLFGRIDLVSLGETVGSIRWLWLFAGYLAIWTTLLLHVWRWQWLLKGEGTAISYKLLYHHYMIGYFFSHFLPKAVGGDMVRAFSLSRNGISKTRSLTVVILARIIGIASLLVALIICVLLSREVIQRLPVSTSALLIGAVCTLLFMVGSFLFFSSDLAKRIFKRLALEPAERMVETLRIYRERKFYLTIGFVISVALQVAVLLRHYFVAKAVGLEIDFATLAVISIMVMALTSFPVTINGIGLRENGFIYLLGFVSIIAEKAFTFSIMNYALMVSMAAIGGAFYIRGVRIKQGSASEIFSVQKVEQELEVT